MAVIQHEVELLTVFEGVLHLDDKGVIHALENAPFSLCMLDLVKLTNDFLLQDFHSVVFLSLLMQYEENFSVGADAEDFQSREVLDGGCLGAAGDRLGLHLSDHVLEVLLEGLFLFFLVVCIDLCVRRGRLSLRLAGVACKFSLGVFVIVLSSWHLDIRL